jgi:ketosteroid isomerase-like protein
MDMPTIRDAIRELGDRWLAAEVDADVDTLETLVTDDFRLVGPYGFVLDKEQWLDRYRSGDFSTSHLSWDGPDIRDHGDAAISIGTQNQEATYKGTPTNGVFRITHVFVRRGDSWSIAGMHLSPTTPPSPPAGTPS